MILKQNQSKTTKEERVLEVVKDKKVKEYPHEDEWKEKMGIQKGTKARSEYLCALLFMWQWLEWDVQEWRESDWKEKASQKENEGIAINDLTYILKIMSTHI